MKIVIIDNYDSFTYNLSHLVKELGAEVTVLRNDCFSMEELEEFDQILLSPGQAIGEVFGGKLINLKEVYHGIQSIIRITADDYIFSGLPEEIPVGRYHSWVVDSDSLPDCLEVTAVSAEGYIMAIRHKEYDVRGIQFHPESVLTPDGKKMIENWISI